MAQQQNQALIQHLRESIMLAMFNCPKNDRNEKIPAGFVPVDRLEYLLNEVGMEFLYKNKTVKLKENLIQKPDRNTS